MANPLINSGDAVLVVYIASPTGDELEIKCSNLAVVVELLRKMSM